MAQDDHQCESQDFFSTAVSDYVVLSQTLLSVNSGGRARFQRVSDPGFRGRENGCLRCVTDDLHQVVARVLKANDGHVVEQTLVFSRA